MSYSQKNPSFREIIKSLGLVFGDIGTSPIYTLSVIFALLPVNLENVMGILSLIIWTLILLVGVQYSWLAMSLSEKGQGEGGAIVLREILIPFISSNKVKTLITLLSFIGIAFFIGDGVITPAISILSAVEGFKLLPFFVELSQKTIILISIVISIILFAFQRKGTEKVSLAFGPIMFVWFLILSILGFSFIIQYPYILNSINPYYAVNFIINNGFFAILLLSKVVLCATGAEALYTDMGHLGKKPIIGAWFLVFFSLLLIYLGQGAFLLGNPQAKNIFYEMVLFKFAYFYVPVLFLSIMATVIASQAMISGIFSIVYQGITTNIMPRLRVEYTSAKIMSQIYIPSVNTFLLLFVLITILKFKSSHGLANAYGLAVSGSMTISAILLFLVFAFQKNILKTTISVFLIFINFLFLFSNLFKIPAGGYWSLVVACFPLILILIYSLGRRKLFVSLKQMPVDQFVDKYTILYQRVPHIKGTAVFFAKNVDWVPKYIARTLFTNNIIYQENIIVKVDIQKTPFGLVTFYENLAPGLSIFEIKAGYLEITNIEKILSSANIHPKVIFYGVEDIATRNIIWKIFKLIKNLTPSFVQFYKLPHAKLHGVIVKVEM